MDRAGVKWRIRYIHCRATDGPLPIIGDVYRVGQIYYRNDGREPIFDTEEEAFRSLLNWEYWLLFVEEV